MSFGIKLSQTKKIKNILLDKICDNCMWLSWAYDEDNKQMKYCHNPYNLTQEEYLFNEKSVEEKYMVVLPEERTCQRWSKTTGVQNA